MGTVNTHWENFSQFPNKYCSLSFLPFIRTHRTNSIRSIGLEGAPRITGYVQSFCRVNISRMTSQIFFSPFRRTFTNGYGTTGRTTDTRKRAPIHTTRLVDSSSPISVGWWLNGTRQWRSTVVKSIWATSQPIPW